MTFSTRSTDRAVNMVVCATIVCATMAMFSGAGFAQRVSSDARSPSASALGECAPTWAPTFGGMPGANGQVKHMQAFDDGSGPALYISGSFTTAGGHIADGIARWDGTSLQPVGDGSGGTGTGPMAVFDDGHGPALYTGGFRTAEGETLNVIARWDGTTWTTITGEFENDETYTPFSALETYDNGSGTALYVGGKFSSIDDHPASNIARWDGESWSAVGDGTSDRVLTMTTFDDGSVDGRVLVVGGRFNVAGQVWVNKIASWNGEAWFDIGGGVGDSPTSDRVSAVTARNAGERGGPALYAGGRFDSAGVITAKNVAKWDGNQWTPLGDTMPSVESLAVGGGGPGEEPKVYAGLFVEPNPGPVVWDGTEWSGVGGGFGGWPSNHNIAIFALEFFDDGDGPALFAGGIHLSNAGGNPSYNFGKWFDGSWQPLNTSLGSLTFVPTVNAVATYDDQSGSGPAVYAGGSFTMAGGVTLNRIAKWNHAASTWEPLAAGVGLSGQIGSTHVHSLAVVDHGDAGGEQLYVGGTFDIASGIGVNKIARWNGSNWNDVGGGVTGSSFTVSAILPLDVDAGGPPQVFVGGRFTAAGGVPAQNVALWDGSHWLSLGGGVGESTSTWVSDMAVYEGDLIVAGKFATAGGQPTNGIARWDGDAWHAFGTGTDGSGSNSGSASALAVFNGELIAGGSFISIDGVEAANIARWDGASWSPFGDGANASVDSLFVFDDGTSGSPMLYAGGSFDMIDNVNAKHIARWDGASWSPVGDGIFGTIRSMTDIMTDEGPALIVGGTFTASPGGDSFIARWQGCQDDSVIPGDLDGSGVVDGADLAILLGAWGPCGDCNNCPADLDGNCEVDGADIAVLFGNWG